MLIPLQPAVQTVQEVQPWYIFEEMTSGDNPVPFFRARVNGDYVRSTPLLSHDMIAKAIATYSGNLMIYDHHQVQESLFQRIGSFRKPGEFDIHFITQPDLTIGDYTFETTNCGDLHKRSIVRESFLIWTQAIQDAHSPKKRAGF